MDLISSDKKRTAFASYSSKATLHRHRQRPFDKEIGILNLENGCADGLLLRRFGGHDERQVPPVLSWELQDRVYANVMLCQNRRKRRDDSSFVFDAKTQIIRKLLGCDWPRLVFPEPLVCKRAHALRAAEANLSCHSHEIADHSHAGRLRTRTASIVKRVFAVSTPDPNRVVRSFDMREDSDVWNQARPNRQQ